VATAIGRQWHEIHFGGASESFDKYAVEAGLWAWHFSRKPSWAIDLDAIRKSGKPYLDHLSSNTRYQIKRSLRLYEQRGPVTAKRARDVDEAMRFYAEMQELHQRYWVARGEPGSYAFPFYTRFHAKILADCIPRGAVEVVRIAAGESTIGYVYNFTSRGWVCAYHTGLAYDPDSKLKPGLVAHYLCIEQHLRENASRYDFLAGDNRYKANLGTPGPEMVHLVLQRPTMGFRAERALRQVKSTVLSRLSDGAAAAADAARGQARGSANRKVLVIGDDTRSFLTIVRSLGRQGVRVHVAPINLRAPALKSRYIAKVHRLPEYVDGGREWIDAVRALFAAERFNLVMPCDERSILPLSAHRNQLVTSSVVAIPDPAAIATLFDKDETKALAASLGVNVARTLMPQECNDPAEVFRRLGTPLMVKPKHSYGLDSLFKRAAVRMVDTPAQLAAITAELDPKTYYYEAYFPGSGVGLSVLADKGDILLAFQHHRVHENERGGASAYRISAPISPELIEACSKVMGALTYTGLAMFEFRRNFTTGDWILLEVNARPWGSMPLPVALGVDFPHAWYRLLVEGKRTERKTYRTGVYGRNLILDFLHIAGTLPKDGTFLDKIRALWAWGSGFWRPLRGRERSDTFVIDDLRPGFVELAEFLSWVASRVGRRLPGAVALQRSLARRQLRAAIRAAAVGNRTISLMFLCHGNICRSPFAERLLAKMLPAAGNHVVVTSAGNLPVNGRPSPNEAIAAARRFGVELDTHRSRYASDSLVNESDVILSFDESVSEELQARFAALGVPIVGMGLLTDDRDAPWEIADPYGEDVEGFGRSYARIERAVKRVHDMVAAEL
jgi:protein-tyrosine-phosphatase/predicted ATP-grasp superfamily ATP-dependent carboligase